MLLGNSPHRRNKTKEVVKLTEIELTDDEIRLLLDSLNEKISRHGQLVVSGDLVFQAIRTDYVNRCRELEAKLHRLLHLIYQSAKAYEEASHGR